MPMQSVHCTTRLPPSWVSRGCIKLPLVTNRCAWLRYSQSHLNAICSTSTKQEFHHSTSTPLHAPMPTPSGRYQLQKPLACLSSCTCNEYPTAKLSSPAPAGSATPSSAPAIALNTCTTFPYDASSAAEAKITLTICFNLRSAC